MRAMLVFTTSIPTPRPEFSSATAGALTDQAKHQLVHLVARHVARLVFRDLPFGDGASDQRLGVDAVAIVFDLDDDVIAALAPRR